MGLENVLETHNTLQRSLIMQKTTPTHTKDWYIKWVSSIILLIGMLLTTHNIYPLNLIFHLIGVVGWMVVALIWNDRALIVVNAVSISIFINGLLTYILK